jgi:hypothetical protein
MFLALGYRLLSSSSSIIFIFYKDKMLTGTCLRLYHGSFFLLPSFPCSAAILVPSRSNDFLAISSLSLFCFRTSSLNILVYFDKESLLLLLENDLSVFRLIICLSKLLLRFLTKSLIDMMKGDDLKVADLDQLSLSCNLENYQTNF